MADKKLTKAAEQLRSKGRGGDSILAHINPQEAELLKAHGGSGTINPKTGLPEFLVVTLEDGTQENWGGAVPEKYLTAADKARLAAIDASKSGGFFSGLQARAFADVAPIWAAVAIPMVGAAAGAALMESGLMTSAASASAAATASGATAAQAAAAGAAATASATAVGTAIANTSYQIAAGVPAEKAVMNSATTAAVQIGTPAVTDTVKKTILSAVSNPVVVNTLTSATVSAAQAAVQGKNASEAFQRGGEAALISQITSQMPGFDSLPKAGKTVVTDAIKAKVAGKDFKATPEYLWNTVINAANQQKSAIDSGYRSYEKQQSAVEGGFTDPQTFQAADELGINTADKYRDYQTVSNALDKEGYKATQEEIKEYINDPSKSYVVDEIRAKYDPLATTSDEAAEFYKTQGYSPTQEELQQYVGNKVEADTSRDIAAYADPRAVIEEEARAEYLAQGIPDPTREELDKYIQQRTESEVLSELDKFADPLGTTAQEARAFAAKYSLDPDSIDNLAALTNARTSELAARESLGEYSGALRSTDPEYYDAQDRAYKYALSRGKSEDEARTFADGYAKTTLGRDVEVGEKPTLTRDVGPVMFAGQEGSGEYFAAPGTRLATLEEVMADQASGAGKTYYDPSANAWVTGIAPDIGDLGTKSAVTTKDLTDYQGGDGSFRIPNPDGSYHMYSSQGVYMGVYTGNDAFVNYEPELSPFDVKPDFEGYSIQDFGGGEAENMDSFNDSMKRVMEERGGFPVGWQQVGTDRIFVYDDGTGIGMNENGDPYELGEDEVTRMVDNGLLNTAASGYEFGSDTKTDPWYKKIPLPKIPALGSPKAKPPSGPRDPGPRDPTTSPEPLSASSPTSALQTATTEKAQGSTLGKMPGNWVGGLGRSVTFIDPLSATEPDLPGQEESEDMYSTSPLAAAAAPRREEEMSLQPEVSYYSYGYEPSYSSIIQPYKNPGSVYAKGGEVMNSPLMAAQGGDVPHKGSHYVQGAGGGQDDLIDAKLADGEYVLDAEIVAALGDGSNKRGAEILDKWRKNIRKHKRSASVDGIPPKAKSPLEYMKGVK